MFEGAEDTNYTNFWTSGQEISPDEELSLGDSLKKLRLRSRKLIRDNSVAAGAQQTFINNIISYGPIVKIDTKGKRKKKEVNDFLDIYLSKIDMSGTESLDQALDQIVGWSFVDGDLLLNLPLDKKRKGVQTVLEIIEAHRISTPRELEKGTNIDQSLVRHGVQYDVDGRIEGYWVKKADRVTKYSDTKDDFTFYPMYKEMDGVRRRVTWLFKAPLNSRPKSARQYPVLTPVITLFKFLKDYLEAVLIGARVAACFSAFVKSQNPAGVFKGMTTDSNGTPTEGPTGQRLTKIQPGSVFYMRPNEDVTFAAPNRPGDNVDAFILRLYKTISMYLRIPYALLFLDMTEVNYSSWRGGVLEAKKVIIRWRRELDRVIEWVVKTIVYEASLRGEFEGDFDAKVVIRWPSLGILDPEKEARANKIKLANGTTSKQRIADEEGASYEELQTELEEEALLDAEREAIVLKKKKELEEKYGILFPETVEQLNRQTNKRPGEEEGEDLDPDDAKERRKEDGNW